MQYFLSSDLLCSDPTQYTNSITSKYLSSPTDDNGSITDAKSSTCKWPVGLQLPHSTMQYTTNETLLKSAGL